ncbi:uncharacterized protein PAC_18447 [Phialocephala subalpina]|uniref:Uncharacterized protein n=1 Tax=Phialocephala subalpina TaxID=576137 RepID=A0A1L7XU46_9HELO|nr:uncharacterized protein PAC_18447 [Phialocephala subalpina]
MDPTWEHFGPLKTTTQLFAAAHEPKSDDDSWVGDWEDNLDYGPAADEDELNRMEMGTKQAQLESNKHERDPLSHIDENIQEPSKRVKIEAPERSEAEPNSILLSGFRDGGSISNEIWNIVKPLSARHIETFRDFQNIQAREEAKRSLSIPSQSEFVIVHFDDGHSAEAAIDELHGCILDWTEPSLVAHSWKEIDPGYKRRKEKAQTWLRLAASIQDAREKLGHSDLEVFEAILSPNTRDVGGIVRKWINEGSM